MIRSNSKKACENIRDYIMQDKDYLDECAAYDNRKLETTDEYLAYAWDMFHEQEKWQIEQNYHCANFGIFLDWARGLALGGLFCYYYNRSAKDDLGAILEETEEEKAKYTEQQAEEMLSRLIYREMENAWKREFRKRVVVKSP